jgi:hypothetical protein
LGLVSLLVLDLDLDLLQASFLLHCGTRDFGLPGIQFRLICAGDILRDFL